MNSSVKPGQANCRYPI